MRVFIVLSFALTNIVTTSGAEPFQDREEWIEQQVPEDFNESYNYILTNVSFHTCPAKMFSRAKGTLGLMCSAFQNTSVFTPETGSLANKTANQTTQDLLTRTRNELEQAIDILRSHIAYIQYNFNGWYTSEDQQVLKGALLGAKHSVMLIFIFCIVEQLFYFAVPLFCTVVQLLVHWIAHLFNRTSGVKTTASVFAAMENDDADVGNDAWGEDEYLVGEYGELEVDEGEGEVDGDEVGEWDFDDDLALSDIPDVQSGDQDEEVVLNPAPAVSSEWPNVSRLAADHVAAGSFETAVKILRDTIGVVDHTPFKNVFMKAYAASRLSHRGWGGFGRAGPVNIHPIRKFQDDNHLPVAAFKLSQLAKKLQKAYQMTTNGKFGEAVVKLREILLSVPLLVVSSKQEVAVTERLITITREYLAALLLETYRKDLPKTNIEDAKRNAELTAYFTHFHLQPMHRILTLRSAVSTFFKLKQMKTCASLCRRLLDLAPRPEVAAQIRKVLAAAERDNTDAHQLSYDEHNPFFVCSRQFVPLYRGRPLCKCPYCGASYSEGLEGQVCNVCQVAEIGRNVLGLRISTLKN